jgi:hypothetical protein
MRTKYIILYLFIVIILIIINKYSKVIDAFTGKNSLAIILRGESFRTGSQDSRNIGSDTSYEQQKEACATHNKLAEKIESLGYNVDFYIDTYSTKYDNDMLGWYGSRVKAFKFHPTHLESQRVLLKDSIDLLKDSLNTYDAVLIIRLDLFLKDRYIDEYNPGVETIQFICVLWRRNGKTPKGNPTINDMIYHYPRKYYDKLATLYTGGSKDDGMRLHNLLDYETLVYGTDYTLLTQNFHDSDSQKDFNPYYRIIGRPENHVWHDEGKEFPRDFI